MSTHTVCSLLIMLTGRTRHPRIRDRYRAGARRHCSDARDNIRAGPASDPAAITHHHRSEGGLSDGRCTCLSRHRLRDLRPARPAVVLLGAMDLGLSSTLNPVNLPDMRRTAGIEAGTMARVVVIEPNHRKSRRAGPGRARRVDGVCPVIAQRCQSHPPGLTDSVTRV